MLARIKDVAERTVSTFATTLLGLLIVSGIGNLDGVKIGLVAALAAALAVLKNLITELIDASNGGVWWQDMLERTGWTYLQSFLSLIVVGDTVNFGGWHAAAVAAVPAALTVLKSFIAKFVGDQNTASFVNGPQKPAV